jgi:hypothetical protein
MDKTPIIRKICRQDTITGRNFWLFGFGWIGCGVKGPPVPPRQPPVPAVSDLAYEVAGQAVMLTWSLPGRFPVGRQNRRHSASTGPEPP